MSSTNGTVTADATGTPASDAAPPIDLGLVYLPGNPGTPVGTFDFIVTADARTVEVGTPVTAETTEGNFVGTVVDMRTVGTDADPVSADLGAGDGKIGYVDEVVVATVQVFASPRMRPVRAGRVRAATRAEIAQATGEGRIDWPVPAGVVDLVGGSYARVCLDGHGTFGPESAHCMIGGLSGQAAKSSFGGVLLRSAIHTGGQVGEATGALIFNVKGEDLLFLDRPVAPGYELSEDDLAMYEALGIPATPFEDVTVYGPGIPGGSHQANSGNPDAIPLRWDLAQVWPYLRYFLPNLYEDEKAQSFLAEFAQMKLYAENAAERIDTFAKLEAWFNAVLRESEENDNQWAWRGHHRATLYRLKRQLIGLVARAGGVITRESAGARDDIPTTGWVHGQVIVVDIAGLTTEVQAFVIARTIDRFLKESETGEGTGLDHLILWADELNAFAPARGGEMATVRKILQRVATQGRYAGISILGMGQALSRVDELIRDNASTMALGVTREGELASGVYGRLSGGLAERVATLPKGSMVLWHHMFRSAMVIRFPRPAWQTGRAKTAGAARRKKPIETLGLSKRSTERLTEGLSPEQVATVVAGADDRDAAIARLAEQRVPDARESFLHEPATFDPNDPFALD